MRAGHTYRGARRNACREGGVLRFWRLSPYRVWQHAKDGSWQVLVRPMPPFKKVAVHAHRWAPDGDYDRCSCGEMRKP